MYELFIGNKNYSSWSLRPWVLLRELNIPFRENLVPFGGAQNPMRSAVLPHRQGARLVDGTITVWDSLAITEYVGERHAGVWPAEARRAPGRVRRPRRCIRDSSRCETPAR